MTHTSASLRHVGHCVIVANQNDLFEFQNVWKFLAYKLTFELMRAANPTGQQNYLIKLLRNRAHVHFLIFNIQEHNSD